MQSYPLILFLIFAFASTSVVGQKKKEASLPFQKFIYKSKGDTLPYAILSPTSSDKNQRYPLLIFLHGRSERGTDNEKHLQHLEILLNENTFKKYPCIVLAPQCSKKYYWSELIGNKKLTQSPTPPLQMVAEIIKKISIEYPVDPNRIYITGVSMGAFGTWELITRFPDQFAAAVPVCGGGADSAADKIKDIPIWAFHGAEDELVPPARSRSMVAAIQNAGGHPGYTEYPGVKHNSWTWAYKEPHLLAWLFKQEKLTK